MTHTGLSALSIDAATTNLLSAVYLAPRCFSIGPEPELLEAHRISRVLIGGNFESFHSNARDISVVLRK
jgi:hypothetical protein